MLIGVHTSIAGGVQNALIKGHELGCPTVQMFVTNQRQWKIQRLPAENVISFKKIREEHQMGPLVAHGSYLINLAAPDPLNYQKSIEALIAEFDRCGQLGLDYYVIHPGSHAGAGVKEGIARVGASIQTLFNYCEASNCKLLLEATAGMGNALGAKFSELAEMLAAAGDSERVGVCLDTCHIFAAGYDIRTPAGFDETIREFDREVGLGRLFVVHVNDSKTGLGSGVDRHEHIGRGNIGKEGFRLFLQDERTRHLPFILETPKGKDPAGRDYDKLNLGVLRRLAK